ncbi:MAG: hypothetical protein OXB88_05840 [Bacteriovoracales bacterium]|nr:hypothetical protein [Bacteriovoracales bacterium]
MKNLSVKTITLLGLFLGVVGCEKTEFGQLTRGTSEILPKQEEFSNSSCALSTLAKPKVDMLFLFDNSTSSFFMNSRSRTSILGALRTSLYEAAQRFDFRIMVAPLITRRTNDVTTGVSVAVENTKGITGSGQNLIVAGSSNDLIDRAASISHAVGSREYGFERARHLLNHHYQSTGIFRRGAHTLVALFSNEDADWRQEGPDHQGGRFERRDFESNLNQLKNISNSMASTQFRFITVVPSRSSGQGCSLPLAQKGTRYQKMSREIYLHNKKDKASFQGLYGQEPYDTFDLCTQDYQGIFTGINNTIKKVLVRHTYDRWPITDKREHNGKIPPFDIDSIRVFKHISNNNIVEIQRNSSDGWTPVANYRSNFPIRSNPTRGEPFNGYFVQLHGNAVVTFPECMRIETLEAIDYFGYIVAAQEPRPSTVKFVKNGQVFGQNTRHGWSYLGYKKNWNVRITSPNNHSGGRPEILKTGYVFKLNGNAVYRNGDKIRLQFLPKPIGSR